MARPRRRPDGRRRPADRPVLTWPADPGRRGASVDPASGVTYKSLALDVIETSTFKAWREALSDRRAQSRISARIARVTLGLMGDVKSLGGGVSEIRVDHGPGYRLYFTRRGQTVVILLCGGDKGSQARDIEAARSMASQA